MRRSDAAQIEAPQGNRQTRSMRVLTVVGHGPTYERAIDAAYAAVAPIHFEGMQYRRDIGRKALAALQAR